MSLFRLIAATGLAGLAITSLAGAATDPGNVLTIVSNGSTRYEILTDIRGPDGVREAAAVRFSGSVSTEECDLVVYRLRSKELHLLRIVRPAQRAVFQGR